MKHANEKAIGAFIIFGVALFIVAVIYIGSANLFTVKEHFVLYFSDSVNGLKVGAPVKFKGVKVGQVKQIVVQINRKEKSIRMPVIIEVDNANLIFESKVRKPDQRFIDEMINRGLRGQLVSESMVTGQLYIELNVIPNSPLKYATNVTPYKQIPTIPSSAQAMTNGLQAATAAFLEAQKVLVKIGDKVDPVSHSLEDTLAEMKDSFASIKHLTDYLARHPESLLSGKDKGA